MKIDIGASDIHDLKPGDAVEIAADVRLGDLLKAKRVGSGKVALFAVDESQARKSRGFIYRSIPGNRKDTLSLVVAARSARPKIEFGIFDFDEFQGWILMQYWGIVEWLDSVLPIYAERVPGFQDGDIFQGAVMCAYDHGYLAVLSLAVKYSLYEDMVDGTYPPGELMDVEGEPAYRARAMLEYHARQLPAKLNDQETFLKRVGVVAGVFVPVAIAGFDFPLPTCRMVLDKLPAPLRRHWRSHKHKDEPLCQFLVATFYFAFRFLVPEGDERSWEPLISCFWAGWEDRLLDVHIALEDESLGGSNAEEEDRDDEEPE
ncbi:MAG: hypothetical protein BWX88_04643 [Planctomycetes bacterium ADurb.Bin126]|nr:MAG: hypothetical protein BWX88_04643 [Planctomycetes bacterium ADurb.Bin126]